MTGQQLIDIIKNNQLEDFEIIIRRSEFKPGDNWMTIQSYELKGLTDIGYSDKVALFGIKERD